MLHEGRLRHVHVPHTVEAPGLEAASKPASPSKRPRAKARPAVERVTETARPDDVAPADPMPLPAAPIEPPAPSITKREAKQANLLAIIERLGSDKLDRLTSYAGHLVGKAPSIASTVAFDWFELGAELSARGSHRLVVAEHAAAPPRPAAAS